MKFRWTKRQWPSMQRFNSYTKQHDAKIKEKKIIIVSMTKTAIEQQRNRVNQL